MCAPINHLRLVKTIKMQYLIIYRSELNCFSQKRKNNAHYSHQKQFFLHRPSLQAIFSVDNVDNFKSAGQLQSIQVTNQIPKDFVLW
jgi:hypothetical protein